MGRALKPDEEVEWKKLQSAKPARKAKHAPESPGDNPKIHLRDGKADAQRRGAIKKP